MVAVGAFYVISVSYLILGLVHIGFPNASKAEVIKGILSLLSTAVSLCVAYLAYRASHKAAVAAENAAESNRLAISIAEKSLFNATFERRLSVYKAMWELKSILDRVDRTIGVNREKPEENYVSKEGIDRLSNLREAIVFESKVLPEQLQTKIQSRNFNRHKRLLNYHMSYPKRITKTNRRFHFSRQPNTVWRI